MPDPMTTHPGLTRYAITARRGIVPARPIDPGRRDRLVALLRAVARAGEPDLRALLEEARTTRYADTHDGRYEGVNGLPMLRAIAVESLRGYLVVFGPHAAAEAVGAALAQGGPR